jgi:hypothetical protein
LCLLLLLAHPFRVASVTRSGCDQNGPDDGRNDPDENELERDPDEQFVHSLWAQREGHGPSLGEDVGHGPGLRGLL